LIKKKIHFECYSIETTLKHSLNYLLHFVTLAFKSKIRTELSFLVETQPLARLQMISAVVRMEAIQHNLS